jgi:hypothetical protein
MNGRQVIDQLNRLLTLDRELTEKLVNTRYSVSPDYKQSEFVWSDEGAGLIGVLSGLVLDTETHQIAAVYDDETKKLIGFSLYRLGLNGKMVVCYPEQPKKQEVAK